MLFHHTERMIQRQQLKREWEARRNNGNSDSDDSNSEDSEDSEF